MQNVISDFFFWRTFFSLFEVFIFSSLFGRHFRRPGELRRRPGPILGAPEPSRTSFSSLFGPLWPYFRSFSGDFAGLCRAACRT